jgi:hypothetical protein
MAIRRETPAGVLGWSDPRVGRAKRRLPWHPRQALSQYN